MSIARRFPGVIKLAYLAEMATVYRKGYGQWKKLAPADLRPDQELPIVKPFPPNDAEMKNRAQKRHDALSAYGGYDLWFAVFLQKCPDAAIVVPG